jgi:hypothetical protein
VASNHGFGWAFGNNAGYTFFSELAAATPPGSLPATYTLGGIFDTGGSAQFGTGEERRPHYELYLMVHQALVTNEHGDPVVGAFASLSGSPQDARNVVSVFADAGLVVFGLVPARPRDVLGAAFSILRFTSDFQQHEAFAGTPVGHGQTTFELTYQVAVAPGWSSSPTRSSSSTRRSRGATPMPWACRASSSSEPVRVDSITRG